jgi:Zinc finger, ZZ type
MNKIIKGEHPAGDDRCRFDYRVMEEEFKKIVRKKLSDENAPMEDEGSQLCPTFVVAHAGTHAEGPPVVFRTYTRKGGGPFKCSIWEAARATSATPLFFKPMEIKNPPPGLVYLGGGFKHNNPAHLAINEAGRHWNTEEICLISIGTGRQKSINIQASLESTRPDAERVRKIMEACAQLSSNSEDAHETIFQRYRFVANSPERVFSYHRFSVDRDMEDIELQEWDKQNDIVAHTSNYMSEGEGEQKRDRCVEHLLMYGLPRTPSSIHPTPPPRINPTVPPPPIPRSMPEPPEPQPPTPRIDEPYDQNSEIRKPTEPRPTEDWMSLFVRSLQPTPTPIDPDPKDEEIDAAAPTPIYLHDDDSDDDDDSPCLGPLPMRMFDDIDSPIGGHVTFPRVPSSDDEDGEEPRRRVSRRSSTEDGKATPAPAAKRTPVEISALQAALIFIEAAVNEYVRKESNEYVDIGMQMAQKLIDTGEADREQLHRNLGMFNWAIGRYGDGCEQFEIAMEQNPANAGSHPGSYVQAYICNRCYLGAEEGIRGSRYKCRDCPDYDLCPGCFPPADNEHFKDHRFFKIPSDNWLRKHGLVDPWKLLCLFIVGRYLVDSEKG